MFPRAARPYAIDEQPRRSATYVLGKRGMKGAGAGGTLEGPRTAQQTNQPEQLRRSAADVRSAIYKGPSAYAFAEYNDVGFFGAVTCESPEGLCAP